MPGLDKALAGVVSWIERTILIDTVRITMPGTGDPIYNPETGSLEYPEGAVLYAGPGAVLGAAAQGDLVAVADANLPWTAETKSRYRLLTPLTQPVFPKDAIVTVTTVHNPANTALIGPSWIITDPTRVGTIEAVRITALDENRTPLDAA